MFTLTNSEDRLIKVLVVVRQTSIHEAVGSSPSRMLKFKPLTPCISADGHSSPEVACWTSDHWVEPTTGHISA